VEALIMRDVGLLYKLLRFMNSAGLGLRRRVESVGHALAMLGDEGIRKWVSVVALGSMVSDRPRELAVQSVVRGNFCEALASGTDLSRRATDLFLTGLLSLLDAIVGRPLPELLDELAVPRDVRAALLGQPSPLGDAYACATAYERGDWPTVAGSVRKLGLDERAVPELYTRSVERGSALFSAAAADTESAGPA
jgi:EAL and modified HD-GYP domain-containing signal transduction protein